MPTYPPYTFVRMMLSGIFYPFYHYFKQKACRRALGACWWAAVAVGWVCAGTASWHHHTTPHKRSSQSAAAARWALPQPSGSLCKQDAIIRPGHLLLQHLTSLFLPSWEHWLYQYICVLLAGSTGYPSLGVLWAPWSASQWEAQGFITLWSLSADVFKQ